MKKSTLFLALILLISTCGLIHAQTFNLQTGREPIASLDGLWRFHTGDNPAWASPNFDDSQWPLLRSDRPWTAQGYKDYGGFAWYRFTIQTPTGDQPLSLLLTDIQTSYRVYADGKLIGGYGYLPPVKLTRSARPEVFDLPRAGEPGWHTIQIAIRVWQDPEWASYEPGGTLDLGNLAGNSTVVHARMRRMLPGHSIVRSCRHGSSRSKLRSRLPRLLWDRRDCPLCSSIEFREAESQLLDGVLGLFALSPVRCVNCCRRYYRFEKRSACRTRRTG